ncbi:hypothetical protein [Streptomyces sp. NBC_01304]|uniref:hypothetical protein n=1 Tax=Streptomyces sp. NBC_01304 TaxID=2903818 RepID=UPI002E104645|nr:hypothetical protein OG430_42385 [Streptomyces sp. NBC_01304]
MRTSTLARGITTVASLAASLTLAAGSPASADTAGPTPVRYQMLSCPSFDACKGTVDGMMSNPNISMSMKGGDPAIYFTCAEGQLKSCDATLKDLGRWNGTSFAPKPVKAPVKPTK